MNSATALVGKCNYIGVELPHGWGRVLNGASSLGAATLSGVLANGTAVSPALVVTLDKAAVSARSVKVLISKHTNAKNVTSDVWLVGGNTYTLTLANVPTPVAASG